MLLWLPSVSFWVTQSCGDGRERPLMQLWLANFWAWIIVLRAVPYTLSFLTPEVNVREVLGPTLNPETVSCTRTNLFHHYMVCILSQHEQDTDSAPYSRDPLAQTKLYPDSLSRKTRSIIVVVRAACLLLSRNPLHHWPQATFGSTWAMSRAAAALCSHLVSTQMLAAGWPAVQPPRTGDGLVHPRDWFPFPLTEKSAIPHLYF